MNEAHVISVDPGVKTLGELRINEDRLAKISRTLTAPGRHVATPFEGLFNALFGINKRVNGQFSGKMLLLRVVCGSLLAGTALLPLAPADITSMNIPASALVMAFVGISMVFGFFSRLISLGGACWFGYSLYTSLMGGIPDLTAGALAMVMMIFSVMGPGLYSLDRMMRRGLLRLCRRSRKTRGHGFDYRAYGVVDRRVS